MRDCSNCFWNKSCMLHGNLKKEDMNNGRFCEYHEFQNQEKIIECYAMEKKEDYFDSFFSYMQEWDYEEYSLYGGGYNSKATDMPEVYL